MDEDGCLVLFWIVVALILIALAIQFWYITLLVAAIAIAIYLIVANHKEKKRLKLEAEAAAREEHARLQHHRVEQRGFREQIIVLGETSMALFESLPQYLYSAEKFLDQAKVDFADNAIVPFWESIENAAKTLGHFDEGVRLIEDNSLRYLDLVKKYEDSPPEFPLAPQSIAKLRVGTATAERMDAIVRTAHRNGEFGMIYMQFKTNQILVAGFANLAQALNRMTYQIIASIDALDSSISGMASTLNDSTRAIYSGMSEIAASRNEHYEGVATRQKKALEMLDNIQRGRRPFP